jgi:opacity protein-like surface antigen
MTTKRWMQAAVLLVALAAFAFAADVTGTWTATFDTQVGVQEYTYVFKQEGTKLTGVAKSAFAKAETPITEGAVNGDDITFVENLNFQDMPLRIVYKGKIAGNTIELTRNVADLGDEKATAKRAK